MLMASLNLWQEAVEAVLHVLQASSKTARTSAAIISQHADPCYRPDHFETGVRIAILRLPVP